MSDADGYPTDGVSGRIGVTGRTYASGELLLIQATGTDSAEPVMVYRVNPDAGTIAFIDGCPGWPAALAMLDTLTRPLVSLSKPDVLV